MQIQWSGLIPLDESHINSLVPPSPGVYVLWVKLQSGNLRCYYVGQAVDLRTRLLEHLSQGEMNQCIKTHVHKHICSFQFALVTRQADRDGIEKYLYDYYKPECNQKDPGGTPIPVNLP